MVKGKSKDTYSKDHVVTILEDLKDQFGVFGDGLKNLERKIDNLKIELNERIDNLEFKFDNLTVKVDGIADDILDIKNKLNQKVSLKDFHKLEKKVFKLEKLVLSKL